MVASSLARMTAAITRVSVGIQLVDLGRLELGRSAMKAQPPSRRSVDLFRPVHAAREGQLEVPPFGSVRDES